jgi:hypothetical protein
MMRQLQDLAARQGAINGQAEGLLAIPSARQGPAEQAAARALARQQRQVARELEELGDAVGGERAALLAREARALADALDAARLDPATLARQQQLFRRLLDAGRSLEREQREETDRREARAGTAGDAFRPGDAAGRGAAAARFREPTWDELRGLSAEDRRLILEYFRRLNGGGR